MDRRKSLNIMKTLILSGIMLLIVAFSYSQHLEYDLIIDSHSKMNAPSEIDSVHEECGYFYVSDTIITNYMEKSIKKYSIDYKMLDLDCKCYYYFAKDNYLIVVNPDKGFILVTQLNIVFMYIRTYYLKSP